MAVGVLALAALPAGYVASRFVDRVDLLWATLAALPAGLLGLAALALARRVRERAALALGPLPGAGWARAGRALGSLAVYLALTTGLAVGVYALLTAFDA